MKVKSKTYTGFGIIIGVSILTFIVILFSLSRISNKQNVLHVKTIPEMLLISDLKVHILEIQQLLTDISLVKNNEDLKKVDHHKKMALEVFDKLIKNDKKNKNELIKLKSTFNDYLKTGLKMTNSYLEQGQQQGNALMNIFDSVATELNKNLNSIITLKRGDLENSVHQADDDISLLKIITMILSILATVISLLFAFIIVRAITKPLQKYSELLPKIAKGDLTLRYPIRSVNCSEVMDCGQESCPDFDRDNVLCFLNVGSYAPEFGKEVVCPKIKNGEYKDCKECKVYKKITYTEFEQMGAWFNQFIDKIESVFVNLKSVMRSTLNAGENLSTITEQTTASTEEISATINSLNSNMSGLSSTVQNASAAIHQISQSLNSLKVNIEQQSSAVNESAASIEEMSASINNMANIANEKKSLSDTLSNQAKQGFDKMESLIDVIDKVSKSTTDISDLITIINGFAEQTNLLAMNAMIESAHAGEYGKGFAVVAQEIRKLAEQTATNSKVINESLKKTVTNMKDAGTTNKLVDSAFRDLTNGIDNVVEAMMELISGMNELSSGTNEILKAITSLNESTEMIKSSSKEVTTSTNEINVSIDSVSQATKDTSNSMDEISIAINEISNAMNDVAESVQNNRENILNLEQEISMFRTTQEKKEQNSETAVNTYDE